MKLSKNKKLYLTSSWQRGFSGFNVRNESRKLCVSTDAYAQYYSCQKMAASQSWFSVHKVVNVFITGSQMST